MFRVPVLAIFYLLLIVCHVACEDPSTKSIVPDAYSSLSEIDTIITVTVHPETDNDFNNIHYQETFPLSPHEHLVDDTSSFRVFDIFIDSLYEITLSSTIRLDENEAFFFLTFFDDDQKCYQFLRIYPGIIREYHGGWVGETIEKIGFFGYSEHDMSADSIWLSLAINNVDHLLDSLFILKPLNLENVLAIPFPSPSDFPANSLLELRLWYDNGYAEDVFRYQEMVDATDIRPFYYTTVDSPYSVSRKFHQFHEGSSGAGWWDYNEWEGYNIVAHAFWLRLPSGLLRH